jgi:DNA ligase-associated metallophosphoesterase
MQIHELSLAGESLSLLADRALYWPRRRTLVVADVHLGKGAAFRRAGVAVASGSTAESLVRLDALLQSTAALRLLVLGDLFHTALADDEPTVAAFDGFRRRHPALLIEAIRGNHDRAIDRLPAAWQIEWRDALHEAPFVFAHEPAPDVRGYVLAGHVHPVLRLRSANDSLRLPVFWFGPGVGVLPSFGAFTGGWSITPEPGDQLIAVTPQGLVPLPRVPLSANPPESAPCLSASTSSSLVVPASSAAR